MSDRGGGCGVLIVVALGVLLGGLFVADYDGSGHGTGHDPGHIDLPNTVEGQPRLGSGSVASLDVASDSMRGLDPPGLSDVFQGTYGPAAGSPADWVVTTADNSTGAVGSWLADNAPSAGTVTTTHPRLAIAGSTTCYQDARTARTMCLWYDENLFLQVAGPTDPAGAERVLLRVYEGSER